MQARSLDGYWCMNLGNRVVRDGNVGIQHIIVELAWILAES